jgi:G:T/U-mismatch repair DNA glycosylase
MPCNHRFQNDLYPQGQLKHLFVGTFNPAWDRPQDDNANWFYGRQYNDFWYIMPQVFEYPSLMPRQSRENRLTLLNYCLNNNIGLTDLINCVNDADENIEEHRKIILSVNDNGFDYFNDIDPTNIIQIINQNSENLCGVYLTRQVHNLNPAGIINQLWAIVTNRCNELGIHTSDLVTPSRQFRQITRDVKLQIWINTINICD